VAGAHPGAGVQAHHAPDVERATWAERNDRLVRVLIRKGFLGPASVVLDFGAGAGHLASAIQNALPASQVVCIEADPDADRHLRANGLRVVPSIDAVGQPADAAIMLEVIEHLEDPVGVLTEMADALRPGGQLFLTTPCGETGRGSRRTRAYETPEHVQFFTERSLQLALTKAGFTPATFSVINALALPEHGVRRVRSEAKSAARMVRARVRGFVHFAGFSQVDPVHPAE
jgi:SAM-dependent methyltransferase